MRAHENWPEARDLLTALWRGERLDRPCIGVTAPSGKAAAWLSPPDNPEESSGLPSCVLKLSSKLGT